MKVKALQVRPKKHPFPILAWVIMIMQGMNPFNKRSYSHMAIMFEGSNGEFMVIDAVSSGVRVMSDETFFTKYKTIGIKSLEPPKKKEEFLGWAMLVLGTEYDVKQLGGLFLKLLNLKKKNSYGSNLKKLTCNELILSYLFNLHEYDFGDTDNYDLNMTWNIIPEINEWRNL